MKLPVSLTSSIGRKILVLKKDSPHIFFVVGVIGAVTSTVLACRATLKLSETLDGIHNELKNIEGVKESLAHSQDLTELEVYTDTQYKKDVTYVYAKAGIDITRLYAPAVIVGIGSISLLTGSHIQLTRRNTALMAAYAAVQRAYDDYRERVREQLGDERELDIYHAAKTEVVQNELGKKEEAKSVDPNKWSPYAKMFDEYNRNWEKDSELNRLFIQCQQNYANNLLQVRGHIFLNEVYDMLGVDRSKAGAVVGWVVGEDGDNFIDFGIYEAWNSRFVNGFERSIVLDFNVDGVIYDKI
jgi:hypothetical protein